MPAAAELRTQIVDLVRQYWHVAHQPEPFVAGKSKVNYAGRVYDEHELLNLVDAALDFWLTLGPYGAAFEKRMKAFFGARDFVLVGSGSSANLLMVATLCAEELDHLLREADRRRLLPGDEVITPAVTFPTTLAPLIHHRLVPVFVDCELGTYNINPALIEDAISAQTRAIFVPHTVGNPCDMATIMNVARRHNLWVLEDGCDALGASFDGQLVGTFGDLSSLSFYPAHHITMGEGGGVVVNHPRLLKTARSVRDWGRDCWCDPGVSNTCGKRFGWQLGQLPQGYDHKYIYSNIGYNLKPTDLQAAVGVAQLDKLDRFVAARRRNFQRLYDGLQPLDAYLILPKHDPRANPSPFGFPITVHEGVSRAELIQWLEQARIETRLVFGGNILRQPGYLQIQRRVHGSLACSDAIMERTFFIGVYPGLTDAMIDYVLAIFHQFFKHPIGVATR